MKVLNSSLATAQFELKRSLTVQRMSAALVMVLFPPAMQLILLLSPAIGDSRFVMIITTSVVVMLSLMLWATSNIHTELEAKSWSFVSSRPRGRLAILYGKFLTSTFWGSLVGWGAITLCMILIEAIRPMENPVGTWAALTVLVFLQSLTYSAVFSLIGVVAQRRAMVFAAAYAVFGELLLGSIPANISKVSVRYHLQGLSFEWLGWFFPGEDLLENGAWEMTFGRYPAWLHILVLLIMAAIALGIATAVIRFREYITSDET